MKMLNICLGLLVGFLFVGGVIFVWTVCGNLQELGIGFLLMALMIFGWPT